jgi:hypothetical protein
MQKKERKMTKSVLSKCEPGSAEQVVAHAALRRLKGKRPALAFAGEKNPRKALALAKEMIRRRNKRVNPIDAIGEVVLQLVSYQEMSDVEIKIATRYIVASSSSEEEVLQRLRDEMDYPYTIVFSATRPHSKTGEQVCAMSRELGGLIMQNGLMAKCMMRGHNGIMSL